ncbi:MAG: aminotransferase class V-fold PLP-dependent enzyme [Thermomicrobiales bacterium]|nr:aminotransferase class V-fold PLP-dependent enzyme [Thermomicrobiales bacterium]
MVDALRTPGPPPEIYRRMGIRTIINGSGAATMVGGSLLRPETAAAMVEASQAFVVIEELNAKVGEKIAEVTGAEAGLVTCGSWAAMALAAAACIAGSDPVKIAQLPNSEGMANEIVMHRAHRLLYDQAYRVGGARIVEIGVPYGTAVWELENAITARTAAVAYHDSPNTGPGALPFDVVVEVAHAKGVPVIVDAASTLPPIDHLRRWIRWGADLVIYSGGKGIRGPQDSGLLAGRKDLIAAAALNGPPHSAVGRGMKITKEAMAGLWVALDQFLADDHEGHQRVHLAQGNAINEALVARGDCKVEHTVDWDEWPAPVLRIWPVGDAWSPVAVQRALWNGDPAISINVERGGLMINTHCLQQGEDRVLIEHLLRALDAGRSA